MRWVVLVGLAAGCNAVFGLDTTHPAIDAAAQDPCAPLPFDTNRYASLSVTGDWSASRTACARYGMDLAAIDANDPTEIANELDGGMEPFWLGVSYGTSDWIAVDGCTPVLQWAVPPQDMAGECMLQNQGLESFPCGSTMAGAYISALCETPRPSLVCLALEAHSTYAIASTAAVDQSTATSMCTAMGMHLVEIDSTAELDQLVQGVAAGLARFWVGAQWDGTALASPTTCPQVFRWAFSQPNYGGGNCIAYTASGMVADDCGATYPVVCESNAM